MAETRTSQTHTEERSQSSLVYALVGAAVMIFLTWIPFVPVVGGAIAGYLEAEEPDTSRSESSRGLRVGALAGAIASIPAAIIGFLIGSFIFAGWFGFGMMGGFEAGPAFGIPLLGIVIAGFIFVGIILYHVAFGAFGGWIGAELSDA